MKLYLHSVCQPTAYEEMFYNKGLQWQDDNSSQQNMYKKKQKNNIQNNKMLLHLLNELTNSDTGDV